MADKRRKHDGRSHLSKEAWQRQHAAAFSRKVARYSTYPDGENGSVVIVEHIDPRCYPIVKPISWEAQSKRDAESVTSWPPKKMRVKDAPERSIKTHDAP